MVRINIWEATRRLFIFFIESAIFNLSNKIALLFIDSNYQEKFYEKENPELKKKLIRKKKLRQKKEKAMAEKRAEAAEEVNTTAEFYETPKFKGLVECDSSKNIPLREKFKNSIQSYLSFNNTSKQNTYKTELISAIPNLLDIKNQLYKILEETSVYKTQDIDGKEIQINMFDINATYKYRYKDTDKVKEGKSSIIGDILYQFLVPYSHHYSYDSGILQFPNIQIFDKLLNNQKISFNQDTFERILEFFIKVYHL